MITAAVNAPYPNRIQVELGLNLIGPFSAGGSPPLGAFDPRRDLEVWVDGILTPISNFSFDEINNRYLLFTFTAFDQQGSVQVIHHMPRPPFTDQSSPPVSVPGFALVASYSTLGDPTGPPVTPGWGLYWGELYGLGVN